MNKPVIYADFSGMMGWKGHQNRCAIPLDTYGSLKGLTNQKVRLKKGMQLIVYTDSSEDEDLEADAIADYSILHGWWVAVIDSTLIRDVPVHRDLWAQTAFLCMQCDHDLEPYFQKHGRDMKTCCPNCGLSIFTATLSPYHDVGLKNILRTLFGKRR